MTETQVHVSDELFSPIQDHFTSPRLVELTSLIA